MLEALGDNSLSENPYALFRCCCATFHTKPHAQLAGVLSFSLFICMVVISLYTFGSFSIFYIALGVIVYSFLMRAVFNAHAEKVGVLAYLVFESIQIGFLAALIMYCMMPVFTDHTNECKYIRNTNNYECVYRNSADSQGSVIQLIVCLSLLTGMKFYFTRVFARYYKYLLWAEQKGNNVHAQYWNSRGVRINVDDVFAAGPNGQPPHIVWSNNGNGYLLNLGTLPTLPSYNQIVGPNDRLRKAVGTNLSSSSANARPPPPLPAAIAPPTWDGEMSTARTAPPTYTLPTTITQHASTVTATVFDQQIPIAGHKTNKSDQADPPPPTENPHAAPSPTAEEHRDVTEQHILASELHNPASNLEAIGLEQAKQESSVELENSADHPATHHGQQQAQQSSTKACASQ